MTEASRYLFLLGAVPFVALGIAHAFHTPSTPEQRKGLSPRDPAYGRSMAEQTVLLTKRTDLWRAWVGFNLSHSLGAVVFGLLVLLVARSSVRSRPIGLLSCPWQPSCRAPTWRSACATGSGRPASGS
jgi:hypothetical protein